MTSQHPAAPRWRFLPPRPLSLRARLLAALLILVICGLGAADIATYSRLRSFLLGRVDQQLDTTHRGVERLLDSPRGGGGYGPMLDPLSRQGTFVQIRDASNAPVFNIMCQDRDGTTSSPQLPTQLPAFQSGGMGTGSQAPSYGYPGGGGPPAGTAEPVAYLNASAAQHGAASFRVRISPLQTVAVTGTLIVAQPLGEEAGTLRSLMLIEILVSVGVLVCAVAAGLWLVRLGLRPLDDIATTAATIAGGDLTQRVARADAGTEVGRLGQSLNRMLGQIEAAFTERSASEGRARQSETRMRRFVADASHELRTPLAAIRAYAELFRRGADRHPEDLPRLLRRIESEAARMGVLVDDLLLLTRLDQGRPLTRRPVDLGTLTAEAVEAARVVEPERPLTLEVGQGASGNGHQAGNGWFGGRGGPVEVLGDQDRLRQVLDNLLANVRAHTPPSAPAQVRVWSDPGRGTAVLEVADSGPGLSREQAERVFERFYRADSSRSRARTQAGDAGEGGAGLGLSIVAAIAAAHGGAAAVRSTPGRGAAFRIELPLLAAADNHDPLPLPESAETPPPA